MNAKKVIEVGVFKGYTTLAMAAALPVDGKVVGLDISEEYVSVARPFWKQAGVEDRIDIRIAPASDTMDGWYYGGAVRLRVCVF
jgi:predicted O-methyltransferase YrrM